VVLCAYFIPTDRKKIFIRVLPFFLIAAAYISFRLFFLPCSKCSVLNLFSPGRIRDFILLSQDYLGQLILPAGLRGLFFGNTLFTKLSFITLAWLSSFVILVGIIIFRKKKLLFGLLFYLIGLLPVVNLVDHIDYFGVILCEHYLYIAGIGIFLILAGTIIFLNKKHGIIAKVLGAGLFLFFCGLTLINNNYYKDPVVFYKHILSLDPGHSFVRVNLGNIYLQKNMFDQAIQEGRSTLIWEEDAWDAYLLLGNAYRGKGQLDLAVKLYKKVIELNPVGIQGYMNLGITLAQAGDVAQAQSVFEDALARFPGSIDLHRNLGVFYANTGNLKKAILIWKEGLVLDPNEASFKENIASANKLLKNKSLKWKK